MIKERKINILHSLKIWPFLFIILGMVGYQDAWGQKVIITLGPGSIGSNEFYTIILTAQDQSLDEYSNFPNIPGFDKAGTSSSSSMRNINGNISNETSIIQNYMPTKEGTFLLPAFTMKVNGAQIKSPGATIKVGPPQEQKAKDPYGADPFAYDPFEDFIAGGRKQDFQDVKADAFLSIRTDKKEIYAGEGINVTLSFLVADENRAELDFYDLGTQLANIVKQMKPSNCWEENFGIEEIIPRKVQIGKKRYTEYPIYQATLFPLVARSFTIPSMKLNMVSYKVSGNSTFFGAQRKQEIKPFYSKELEIKVKDLPPHPMKGQVSVGRFSLSENLAKRKTAINQGVGFEMTIKGEGNITYILEPSVIKSELGDIYPPNTRQTIQRAGGRVTGEKVFSYLIVPKEQGSIHLRNSFLWVYFNTEKARYDTLRPAGDLFVVKGKAKNAGNSATSEDSFYSLIDRADHAILGERSKNKQLVLWVNIALGLMASVTLWLSFRR